MTPPRLQHGGLSVNVNEPVALGDGARYRLSTPTAAPTRRRKDDSRRMSRVRFILISKVPGVAYSTSNTRGSSPGSRLEARRCD